MRLRVGLALLTPLVGTLLVVGLGLRRGEGEGEGLRRDAAATPLQDLRHEASAMGPGGGATLQGRAAESDEVPRTQPALAAGIRGRVVDARRQGIAGVEVRLVGTHLRMPDASTLTDAEGAYALPLAPGRIRGRCFVIARGGAAQIAFRPVGRIDGAWLYIPPIRLGGGHAATFRLLDEGSPVAHPRLYVVQEERRRRRATLYTLLATAQGSADGRVKTPLLPVGRYRIVVADEAGRQSVSYLALPSDADQEFPLALPRGREFQVRVRDEATGRPIPGATVEALQRGYRAAMPCVPRVYAPPTAGDGRTRLWWSAASFGPALLVSAKGYSLHEVSRRAVGRGDGVIEVTLARRPPAGTDREKPQRETVGSPAPTAIADPDASEVTEFRVTIDGQPGLPPEFEIRHPGKERGRVEIPEEGRIVLTTEVPREEHTNAWQRVGLEAEGYAPAEVAVEAASYARPRCVHVALRRATWLSVRVARVVGRCGGPDYRLQLQRREEGSGRWLLADASPRHIPGGASDDTLYRTGPLDAGSYRVLEPSLGILSPTVDLKAGQGRVDLAIDVASAGCLRGVVHGRPGFDLTAARVRVVDSRPSDETLWWPPDVSVKPDGRFQIGIPGNRPVGLCLTHPELRAARGLEDLVFQGSREEVVLQLVEGPTVSFTVAIEETETSPDAQVTTWRPDEASPLGRLVPVLFEDGQYIVRGLPHGRSQLWIALPGYVPRTLPAFTLEDEDVNLGAVALSRGTTLVVRLPVRPDAPAEMSMSLHRVGRYEKIAKPTWDGDRSYRIPGLHPGAYRLYVHRRITGPSVDVLIEIEGSEETVFEVEEGDFR